MNLFIILFLVNFLRTLFIIALVYYAIRIFTKYILPALVDKGIKNMQQKMHEQQNHNVRNSRREGEVTLETNQKNNKSKIKNEGDYVDFEEID